MTSASPDLESLFSQTLEDRRLSRSERRALTEIFREDDTPLHERREWLARAFDAAGGALDDPRGRNRPVIDWLEDVVKAILTPPEAPPAAALAEAHFAPHEDCAERLIELCDEARVCLDVCVFTVTDNRLSRALLNAKGRGVRVRLITDNDKSWDRGSDIHDLARDGMCVRMDDTDDHMHHKFMVVDREILVTGSYNWTRSASTRNRENVAITDDPRLVERFLEEFDRLWEVFSVG